MLLKAAIVFLCLTTSLFANLPYAKIHWPADDKPHQCNENVVTEWWYFTGKLTATDGNQNKHFAYYVTLKYTRDLKGEVPTLDVQITDIDNRIVYGNSMELPDARQATNSFRITATDFSLQGNNGKYNLKFNLPNQDKPINFNLVLTALKKPLLIGSNPEERGLIDMGNNTNSFYYSITRLQTAGLIQIGNERYTIHPDHTMSRSWMDHQWGDFSLSEDSLKDHPWIWMGMQLSDGTDINVCGFISTETGQPLSDPLVNISKYNNVAEYKTAKMKAGFENASGYPLSYSLQIDETSYHLNAIVPNENKHNSWNGIMKMNGQDVLPPNAPFAIVENTIQPSG